MKTRRVSDTLTQHLRLVPETEMQRDITAFLIGCQAEGRAAKTLEFYECELRHLRRFLETIPRVTRVTDIDPTHLRAYLLHLRERGRNPGGRHAAYCAMRRFLRWYEAEFEPEGWRNPIKRVKAPKVPDAPLPPVPLADVRKMLATCPPRTHWGDRARAILMALLDTGCRASEFLALDVADLDMRSGTVIVRHGKGGKRRVVFAGATTRQAIARYLRWRGEVKPGDPLWTNKSGKRMTYDGLKSLVRRRAEAANVPYPGLHAFRRAFTTLAYREGANILELRDLLGHSDLSVLRRYLRLTEDDLRRAHQRTGPVDNLL